MSSHTQSKRPPLPRPLVKQASTLTSCGMWSEGGTELFLEAFYIFLSQQVGLPGQFELLAVSAGQAEGGSIEANLSKHWLQHKHRSDSLKGRFIVVDVLNIKLFFFNILACACKFLHSQFFI